MTYAPRIPLLSLRRQLLTASLIISAALLFFPCGAATAQTPVAPPASQLPSGSTPPPAGVKPSTLPTASIGKRQLQAAEDAYLDGARLLDHKELAAAETQFAKAVKLNPGNSDYVLAFAVAHENRVTDLVQQAGKARLLGQTASADSLLAQARTLDPQNSLVIEHIIAATTPAGFTSTIAENNIPAAALQGAALDENPIRKTGVSYAGAISLTPAATPQSFHIHLDVQQVATRVATAFGIRAVFDPSVVPQSIRFDLDNTTYTEAMPILLQMGRLFAVPLDAHSVLIAKDTPENRQRLERLLEETIYVPALTVDQLSELNNVIRNIFDVKQVSVQNNGGSIAIRAPESILSALNLTLSDLIDGGSQVLLDLKLYSIDKSRTRNIGAQLPQQFGVYNVEGAAHDLVTANQSLVNQGIAQGLIPAGSSDVNIALALIASGLVQSTLLSNTIGFFGGGITQTGLTSNVSTTTFNLALNSSDTRALDDIQLRIGDRQSATFRIGSRYPVTTSTYSFQSSAATSPALNNVTINGVPAATLLSQFFGNAASSVVPQIQYEDLGITLKASPIVQKTNNVTVTLDLKIEALTGGSINNIPILASRQFTSEFTIEDGKTAMLISSLSKTESNAVSGLPGLAELPGFQTPATDKTAEQDSSELVLLITPHIVRRRSGIISGPRIAINLPPSSE